MNELQTSLTELISNQRAMLEAQSALLASVYDKQVVDNKLNAKLNITDFTAIKNAINMHLSQKSFTDNGYTKLPNGLILQWGLINAKGGKADTARFNIAFPNKCLFATISANSLYVGAGSNIALITAISNTNFTFTSYGVTEEGVFRYAYGKATYFYFAIGY